MNKMLIIAIIAFLVLGGGWYLMKSQNAPTSVSPESSPETVMEDKSSGVIEKKEEGVMKNQENTVTYGDTGFSPKSFTVKVGTTVTFVNSSSKGMWVASAVHPTHQELPGFDELTSVEKGGTYNYTFTKVGTWKYHNHVNASDSGSVEVTQ